MNTGKNPNPTLQVGDKVTWTHISSNGTRYRFRTREGTIRALGTNDTVWVWWRGKEICVFGSQLRRSAEKTELTEAFEQAAENLSTQEEA